MDNLGQTVDNDDDAGEDPLTIDYSPSHEAERVVHMFITSAESPVHLERLKRIQDICARDEGDSEYASGQESLKVTCVLVEGPHLNWFDRKQAPYYTLSIGMGSKDVNYEADEEFEVVSLAMAHPDTRDNVSLWAENIVGRFPYMQTSPLIYKTVDTTTTKDDVTLETTI